MGTAAGLLCALASALALNWGFFAQHEAAGTMPALSLARPLEALATLARNLRWLAGYLVGWVGWGLYVLALHLAALSVVQAVAAGGIGVLALLVHRKGATTLNRREALATAVAILGLAGLALSLLGGVPRSTHAGATAVALGVGCTAALGVAFIAALRGPRSVAFALGSASGLWYAAGDVATKGALGGSGLVFVPVLLACHVGGFIALQLAFQRGRAIATAGSSSLLNNAVPILAGVVLFGERLPAGLTGVLRGASFVLVVLAAVLLARSGGSS